MTFKEKWLRAVRAKNSQLCVGLDPADYGQRSKDTLPQDADKLSWCLEFVDAVAPYAAAIKINRNFIKDFSRRETQRLCQYAHDNGLVLIDDAKLCDVGSSNEAGFYHAAQEGFDAITYSPFPGNIEEATIQAHKHNLGIIVLLLMSNPQFQATKQSVVGDLFFHEHSCNEILRAKADAVVIGAISPDNHLRESEIKGIADKLIEQLVLVPGIGEQGGSATLHLNLFGERAIINVGRSILYSSNCAAQAQKYAEVYPHLP